MMMASYLCPRRISRSTNLAQSSTIQRTFASATPDAAALSLRPGDHALRGVHVADARARGETGDARPAGVGKEIQNADRTVRLADLFLHPVPVCRLFGEETGVLEVHGLHMERERAVADVPARRETALVPRAAAGVAAAVAPLRTFPDGGGARRFPDDLRVGRTRMCCPQRSRRSPFEASISS